MIFFRKHIDTERMTMTERQTGKNQITAKHENVSLIKSLIYSDGPISRAQIAAKLGLTPPTITNIIGEMIEQGLVEEIREDAAKNAGKAGRHPIMVDFIARSVYALGISLGRDKTHYCITDLRGNPVMQGEMEVMPDGFAKMMDRLYGIIESVRRNFPECWEKLAGIGIAVPAIVDAHIGVIKQIDQERVSWKDQPLAQLLQGKYGLPVRVENNVRARTYMISLFRPEITAGYNTYCLCYASWGIACPMIVKNKSIRGEGGAAGELGHIVMDPETGATLEEYASLKSVLQKCRKLMEEGKAPVLSAICSDPASLTIEQIGEAQKQGDEEVRRVMETAMRYIGISLSSIVSFINPELIILSGPMFLTPEHTAYAEQIMRQYAYTADITHTVVKYAEFSDYGGALAAAAACLDKYFIR